jgi:hypothetical protein
MFRLAIGKVGEICFMRSRRVAAEVYYSLWLLMRECDLKSRGFCLVAKPPHGNSALGQSLDEAERQKLWRYSFPHLETEHMAKLDSDIKDAYIAAKCLRNPDVCRILIQEDDGLLRPVDSYITSYLLKTVFLQRVEEFILRKPSKLIDMVHTLYKDLESRISVKAFCLYSGRKM